MPNQPAFFGSSGGGNSTAASGAGVIDTAGTDAGNNFNTSNGRFTCPVAGRYLVTWTIMNSQNNQVHNCQVPHNSTPINTSTSKTVPAGAVGPSDCECSANDFFDLDISHFHTTAAVNSSTRRCVI